MAKKAEAPVPAPDPAVVATQNRVRLAQAVADAGVLVHSLEQYERGRSTADLGVLKSDAFKDKTFREKEAHRLKLERQASSCGRAAKRFREMRKHLSAIGEFLASTKEKKADAA